MILTGKLERLLQANWAEFFDNSKFMKAVVETANATEYRRLQQDEIPAVKSKVTITRFALEGQGFEIWAEFTVPKGDGVVIGTHIYFWDLQNEPALKDTFGTHFLSESP